MVKISKKNIGIIIVDEDNTPNPDEFSLVLTKTEDEFQLQKGMYVLVSTLEGDVIASVSNVYKTNRYFSSPSAVRAYETSGKTLASIFPADRWEHIIAKAKPLGILTEIGIQRLLYPVSPGETVYIPDNEILAKFLGLEKTNGLNLGAINQHNINVNLNLTRFLQKHAAILAISGAGKSYAVSVIKKNYYQEKKTQGRVSAILFDIHGEYKGLGAEESQLRKHVEIFPGAVIQFATSSLSSRQFAIYQPQITSAQTRELSKILSKMYHERVKKGETYLIKDIINELELDEQINVRSKEALIGWLFSLEETRLFGAAEYPSLQDILKPGKLVIFDLSEFTSLKLKQMIVSYILFRIFNLRKKNQVPPSTIIIEEAHQLCPDARLELAISKSIIETIAREGRKFFTSLILVSQRPVKLSTTALSQCNTHVIMKILNPYDLDFIGRSSEGIDRATLNAITGLGVGEAVIVGNAVNHPIFVKIRERRTKTMETQSLEESAKSYES
ncbi:MAG: ATP-binding protein [Candidatus Heimdallarchaeota archaeon]|nr:ATP-binding protein [Candidatus Heimdallarchaeota archaeon]MCK4955180.1 ATP-binding protein [Candidatus Heimdallarchaeota archaeon]